MSGAGGTRTLAPQQPRLSTSLNKGRVNLRYRADSKSSAYIWHRALSLCSVPALAARPFACTCDIERDAADNEGLVSSWKMISTQRARGDWPRSVAASRATCPTKQRQQPYAEWRSSTKISPQPKRIRRAAARGCSLRTGKLGAVYTPAPTRFRSGDFVLSQSSEQR